ncbi:MAG TPA: hypothetical protein VKR06_11390 [Ktedonosporobacter sp.]|nr:hypothetical protein [Ktedonosporobacter sp.]
MQTVQEHRLAVLLAVSTRREEGLMLASGRLPLDSGLRLAVSTHGAHELMLTPSRSLARHAIPCGLHKRSGRADAVHAPQGPGPIGALAVSTHGADELMQFPSFTCQESGGTLRSPHTEQTS